MTDKFTTVIDKFVVDTEAKLMTVARESIDALIQDAQTPVARGGRMRVKTGFLRSTGVAALNSIPLGPRKGDKNAVYAWEGEPVNLALARMKAGDTFYFGWTAFYAKYREAYDGFLDSAVQNWQSYVDASVRKYRK